MSDPHFTPGPWGLCHHLKSPEHDKSCSCGYRGGIWSGDGEYLVCEMGSSPDVDGNGYLQGHSVPMADRPTQLADAALIAAAPSLYASLKAILGNSGGRCTADQWQAGLSAIAMVEDRLKAGKVRA